MITKSRRKKEISRNIDIFNKDAEDLGGYVYTNSNSLSCRLATQCTIDVILKHKPFRGKSVLDVGCGDGFFTIKFWDKGCPFSMIGIDAASIAIKIARKAKESRPLTFIRGDVHKLPFSDNSFDLVLLQSILHHDENPAGIVKEAFRVAPKILIHEPNGNNLGLKIIEKVSDYHRRHNEKSYLTFQIANWIHKAGGKINNIEFAGFVPMFCSDSIAKIAKFFEPAIESLPLVRNLFCSVTVISGSRI